MNVPHAEIAKQRAEADRLAQLAAHLNGKEVAVKAAVSAKVEALLDVIYPLLAANALASEDGTANLTFDLSFRFSPRGDTIEATARSVSQPREFHASGGL